MDADKTKWATPQEPFYKGTCDDCGGTIEPQAIELDVDTPKYKGPLVVLAYQDMLGTRKLAINGTVFAWTDIAKARDHATELLGDHADHVMFTALSRINDHSPGTEH